MIAAGDSKLIESSLQIGKTTNVHRPIMHKYRPIIIMMDLYKLTYTYIDTNIHTQYIYMRFSIWITPSGVTVHRPTLVRNGMKF